jgi:hypothetical protein
MIYNDRTSVKVKNDDSIDNHFLSSASVCHLVALCLYHPIQSPSRKNNSPAWILNDIDSETMYRLDFN